MPALNFRKVYAPAVEAGLKEQTIRAPRADGRAHAKLGDRLALYVGMRTKGCRKLRDATVTGTHTVVITSHGEVWIDSVALQPSQVALLAYADGFDTPAKFLAFFEETHGLPFSGTLIRWNQGAPAWIPRPSFSAYFLDLPAGESWRPANGTEGDIFQAAFCSRCLWQDRCLVIEASMANDLHDDDYPPELRISPLGVPECAAWWPAESKDPSLPDVRIPSASGPTVVKNQPPADDANSAGKPE